MKFLRDVPNKAGVKLCLNMLPPNQKNNFGMTGFSISLRLCPGFCILHARSWFGITILYHKGWIVIFKASTSQPKSWGIYHVVNCCRNQHSQKEKMKGLHDSTDRKVHCPNISVGLAAYCISAWRRGRSGEICWGVASFQISDGYCKKNS